MVCLIIWHQLFLVPPKGEIEFPADVKQDSSPSAMELRDYKIGRRSVRPSDTADINS